MSRLRAVPRASCDSTESGALSFVCSCQRILTTRRAQGWCRPRSKPQVGFEKEDQDSVSASAAAKNASCCPCAQRRLGIHDRDRPLPSSRPLARSLCGHTTRSRLADAEAGKIPCVGFYGDRICGTSRSDILQVKTSSLWYQVYRPRVSEAGE